MFDPSIYGYPYIRTCVRLRLSGTSSSGSCSAASSARLFALRIHTIKNKVTIMPPICNASASQIPALYLGAADTGNATTESKPPTPPRDATKETVTSRFECLRTLFACCRVSVASPMTLRRIRTRVHMSILSVHLL